MSLSKCVRWLVFTSILALAMPGLAQTNALPHISATIASNYLDQEVVVVDKVAQVSLRTNIWLLHLNQKFPVSPLNAVIRKGATNNFPNIEDYRGKRVEITGRIVQGHGRLELALTSPDQIKIIGGKADSPASAPIVAATPAEPVSPVQPKEAAASTMQALTPAPATPPVLKADDTSSRTLNWILGLLAVIGILVAAGVLTLWRRPAAGTRALASSSSNLAESTAGNSSDSSSTEDWKQRALAAEAMAGKQGEILREKMIPELTEFAKQSLVQGLYAQRNALMETQRKAQLALGELE